jgi:hypothetical protein
MSIRHYGAILAWMGVGLSLFAHLFAYLQSDFLAGLTPLLSLPAFVLLFVAYISFLRIAKKQNIKKWIVPIGTPTWARIILGVCFAYNAISLCSAMSGDSAQNVKLLNGNYILYNNYENQRFFVSIENKAVVKGEIVVLDDVPVVGDPSEKGITIYREISEKEYRKHEFSILRFFSGGWIFVYLWSAIRLWFKKPKPIPKADKISWHSQDNNEG